MWTVVLLSIIDLNLEYPKGRDEARKVVEQMIADTISEAAPLHGDQEGISESKSRLFTTDAEQMFEKLSEPVHL